MSIYIDPSTWNLRTEGGVPYCLMEGYPKINVEEEAASAEEQYIIQSVRFVEFIRESFSDISIAPGIGWNLQWGRSLPGAEAFLVTKKVSAEPFPTGLPGDPLLAYMPAVVGSKYLETFAQFVKVTISYGTGKANENNNNDAIDILEVTANGTGEYLCIPSRGDMKWDGGDVLRDLNLPIVKVLPQVEWSIKFPRVAFSYLPTALSYCRSVLGKVNSSPLAIVQNAPAETVLFTGFSIHRKYTWRDKKPFADIDIKLLEKLIPQSGGTVGHNHFYRPDKGRWEKIKRPDGSYVYDSTDLNAMFSSS